MTGFRDIFRRMLPIGLLVGAVWIAHLVNIFADGALTRSFGLVPRRLSGLDGVIAMPFLHGSWEHLWSNTTPMLLLGGLILALAPERFLRASLIVLLLGGALTWLFGRDNNHIGASGLIFGWFGFLVALGLLERSRGAIFGAVVAILLYGASTLVGLDPRELRISWDGHLAGLAAGFFAAWVLQSRRRPIRSRAAD